MHRVSRKGNELRIPFVNVELTAGTVKTGPVYQRTTVVTERWQFICVRGEAMWYVDVEPTHTRLKQRIYVSIPFYTSTTPTMFGIAQRGSYTNWTCQHTDFQT